MYFVCVYFAKSVLIERLQLSLLLLVFHNSPYNYERIPFIEEDNYESGSIGKTNKNCP